MASVAPSDVPDAASPDAGQLVMSLPWRILHAAGIGAVDAVWSAVCAVALEPSIAHAPMTRVVRRLLAPADPELCETTLAFLDDLAVRHEATRAELMLRHDWADAAGLDPDTQRQSVLVERASRPLGFSYRPLKRPLPTQHAETNRTLQCVEPTRRKTFVDDAALHSTPRKGLLAGLEDVAVSEDVKLRVCAALAHHVVTYGTLYGMPPLCAPALFNVADALELDIDTCEANLAAVKKEVLRQLATLAGLVPALRGAHKALLRVAVSAARAEDAEAAATLTGKTAPHFVLRDLPSTVVVKNPFSAGTFASHTGLNLDGDAMAALLLGALGSGDAGHILRGFVLPLLIPTGGTNLGALVPAALLRRISNNAATVLDNAPTLPVALPCEPAQGDGLPAWPLTPAVVGACDALLQLCRSLERLHMLHPQHCATLAAELRTTSAAQWQLRAAAVLGEAEATSGFDAIPAQAALLRMRLARCVSCAWTCGLFGLLMQGQGRGAFDTTNGRPSTRDAVTKVLVQQVTRASTEPAAATTALVLAGGELLFGLPAALL